LFVSSFKFQVEWLVFLTQSTQGFLRTSLIKRKVRKALRKINFANLAFIFAPLAVKSNNLKLET